MLDPWIRLNDDTALTSSGPIDAIVLYDTFGNLANIAGTSHEQLMECCIPQAVADAIHDFFSSDCVPL